MYSITDVLRSNKKLKKKFIRSKSQCSTPLQSSTFNTNQNKLNNSKKSKIKKKLVNVFDDQFSSNIYKKSSCSQLSSSLSMGINDKYNQFEQSIQIAGSHGLSLSNKQISKKYTYALNSIGHDGKKNRKVVLNISKRHCIKKKKSSSKEKHSNWYQKVMDIIGVKENHSSNNLHNKEFKTDESLDYYCSKSVTPLKNVNNKPLEQQILRTSSSPKLNNKSFQPLEHIEDIKDIKNEVIIKSQSYMLYDDSSNSYCNSLYDTCYEVDENKVIESIRSSNDVCKSDSIVGDESIYGKTKNVENKSPQQNQCKILSSSNTTHIKQNTKPLNSINMSCNLDINYSIESCADSLDIKLVNILERCEIPNVDQTFNNQQSVFSESNSKSLILRDVTNKLSDILIKNEITNYDQSLDKSIPNILCNNSSVLHSSYCFEQDTVIYKQNPTDDQSIENASNPKWFFDENMSFITPTKHSLRENSLKDDVMYDSMSLSKNKDITFTLNNDVEKTQTQENSLIDFVDLSPIKCEQNTTIEDLANTFSNSFNDLKKTSKTPRRKRYGTRFQNNFNVIEESFDENVIEVKNSTQKYIDVSQSTQHQQNVQGFRLEPGKKWRRSIIIVRSFIDGNLDHTANVSQNITKGRKWMSTVDEVLRQQSLGNCLIYTNLIVILYFLVCRYYYSSKVRSKQYFQKLN